MLNRALEKQPNDRYQSINDSLIDLKRVKKESDKTSPTPIDQIPPAIGGDRVESGTKPKRKLRALVTPVIALIVLALVAISYFAFFGRAPQPSERISLAVADFDNKTGEKELLTTKTYYPTELRLWFAW